MNKKVNKFSAILILSVFVVLIFSADIALAGKIMIPKDTKVTVRFDPTMVINSKTTSQGIPLLINLVNPIEIGGVTIVEKGAAGTASVVEAEPAKKGGKSGYIKIEFIDLEPKGDFGHPDGEKIKLAGEAEGKGKGKKLLSWLFIFGLFIKGGEGTIPTDQFYEATVAENIILESE
jgi:hypothetical protein